MFKAVTGVVPLADYQLLLTFAGGESRVFDVARILEEECSPCSVRKPYLTRCRSVSTRLRGPMARTSVPNCCTRTAAPSHQMNSAECRRGP